MPRAKKPDTPDHELAARRANAAAEDVLTPELKAFCESGISVILGVCDRDGAPVAGLAWGCRVLPDGRLRIVIPRAPNEALLAIVEAGGARMAATFSRPVTHRSIQVKGSGAVAAAADEEDREAATRQADGLRRELIEIDYPPAFSAAYCRVDPDDVVAVELTPEAAFVQTPGPGAGEALKP